MHSVLPELLRLALHFIVHALRNLESMVGPEVNPTPSHHIQTLIVHSPPFVVLKLQVLIQTNLVPPIVDTP